MYDNLNVILEDRKEFGDHEYLIENDFLFSIKIEDLNGPPTSNQEVCYENMHLKVPSDRKTETKNTEKGEPNFGAINNTGQWCQYTFMSMLGWRGGKFLDHHLPTWDTPRTLTLVGKEIFNS